MVKVIERESWSVVEKYSSEFVEVIEEEDKYLIDESADLANADEWDKEKYFVIEE